MISPAITIVGGAAATVLVLFLMTRATSIWQLTVLSGLMGMTTNTALAPLTASMADRVPGGLIGQVTAVTSVGGGQLQLGSRRFLPEGPMAEALHQWHALGLPAELTGGLRPEHLKLAPATAPAALPMAQTKQA